MEEMQENAGLFSKISVGDAISIVFSLVTLGVVYGTITGRIDRQDERMGHIQAAQSIRDNLQDEALRQVKTDTKEALAEIKDAVQEINRKLDRRWAGKTAPE